MPEVDIFTLSCILTTGHMDPFYESHTSIPYASAFTIIYTARIESGMELTMTLPHVLSPPTISCGPPFSL